MSSSFKTLGGVIATLGIANFIKDSNTAYTVQMQNEVKLQTIMRQRMGSTAQEIEQIKTLASEQQKLGIIGDEVQLAGLQQLATFASQESTLQTLLPAMNNLIAQQDGYAASTSGAINIGNLMGKVLQGQTSALTRVGITFTEAQEKVLKYGNEQERAAMLAEVITDNVGEMNEALRGTSTGALTALNNDLGDMKELVGESFQPLISSFVPVLSDLLQELQPIISGTATGIEVVADAFNTLPEPLQNTAVAVAVVTGSIVLLNKTVGKTASGIILLGTALAWLIGKWTEGEKDAAQAAEKAAESAKGASDDSIKGQQDYQKEIDKTVAKLAGFDEITKLSGGKAIDSDIVSDESLDKAEELRDTVEELTTINKDINLDFAVPEIDVDKIFSGVEKHIGNIRDGWLKVFSLNPDEQLEGLRTLDKEIRLLFGDNWSDFWTDVGSKIYRAFDENAQDSNKALMQLNDDVRKIFGEDWTNFWMGVGSDIAGMIDGVKRAITGDIVPLEQALEEAENAEVRLFEQMVSNGFTEQQAFNAIYKTTELKQQFVDADAAAIAGVFGVDDKPKYERLLSSVGMNKANVFQNLGYSNEEILKHMEDDIKLYIQQGYSGKEALAQAKLDYGDSYGLLEGDFINWYQNLSNSQKLDDKVSGWEKTITPIVSNTSPNMTYEDVYRIFSIANNQPSSTIVVNNYMDAEEISSRVIAKTEESVGLTNGRNQ